MGMLIYNLLNWRWRHRTEASVTIPLSQYCKLLSKIQLLEKERQRAEMDKSRVLEKKLLTDKTIADVISSRIKPK